MPPDTAQHADAIINGTTVSDDAWRPPSGVGLAAKLIPKGVGSCTAVPLADQWMLTSAHCFFTAERTLKFAPSMSVNGPNGWTGLWDGNNGLPAADRNWVVVAHPARDLALVRRWPLAARDPALPTLTDDPSTFPKRLTVGDRVDSLLGFGCTNFPSNPGNSLTLFSGAMVVDASGIQTPASGQNTLASWNARLVPIAGSTPSTANFLGRGDSGGPARRTLTYKFDALGAEGVVRNVLVGINYASVVPQGLEKDFTACPHATVGTLASRIVTFDPSPASTSGTDPLPIEWIHAERTRLAGRSPTASLPPTPAGVPGTAFPPTGPDSFPYPNVAWVDIDGDGLHDA